MWCSFKRNGQSEAKASIVIAYGLRVSRASPTYETEGMKDGTRGYRAYFR